MDTIIYRSSYGIGWYYLFLFKMEGKNMKICPKCKKEMEFRSRADLRWHECKNCSLRAFILGGRIIWARYYET